MDWHHQHVGLLRNLAYNLTLIFNIIYQNPTRLHSLRDEKNAVAQERVARGPVGNSITNVTEQPIARHNLSRQGNNKQVLFILCPVRQRRCQPPAALGYERRAALKNYLVPKL